MYIYQCNLDVNVCVCVHACASHLILIAIVTSRVYDFFRNLSETFSGLQATIC